MSATLLDEVRAAYDAARALRARHDELQTVDQARAAYDARLGDDEAACDAERRRLEGLEAEWRRQATPAVDVTAPSPWPFDDESEPERRPPAPPPPDPSARLAAVRRERRNLRTLANRYRYVWKLDASLLGRINAIADDSDRPLGEALVLLPWEAFLAGPSESEPAHAARLTGWGEALRDYRDYLAGKVAGLEARADDSGGIWKLWRERDGDGAARWETFLVERRRVLREEAARLRTAADAVEERLRGAGRAP